MATNVTDELQVTIDRMLGPSEQRLRAVSTALAGAGAESLAAYKSLTSFASGMVNVGRDAAKTIAELRADEATPRDYRLSRENEARDTARLMLSKLSDGGMNAAGQLESALTNALLPAPHRDTSQRLLTRDELKVRYSRLDGEALVSAVVKNLGQNPTHDSEVLGTFGTALLESAGAAPDQVKAIRAQAVNAYMGRADGSHQQQAARKALAALREANLPGVVAAHREAGRLRLQSVDG